MRVEHLIRNFEFVKESDPKNVTVKLVDTYTKDNTLYVEIVVQPKNEIIDRISDFYIKEIKSGKYAAHSVFLKSNEIREYWFITLNQVSRIYGILKENGFLYREYARRGSYLVAPEECWSEAFTYSKDKRVREIVDFYIREIASTNIKPGERFPTRRSLKTIWNVPEWVVRYSCEELRDRGFIIPARGRGTIVKELTQEQLKLLKSLVN